MNSSRHALALAGLLGELGVLEYDAAPAAPAFCSRSSALASARARLSGAVLRRSAPRRRSRSATRAANFLSGEVEAGELVRVLARPTSDCARALCLRA